MTLPYNSYQQNIVVFLQNLHQHLVFRQILQEMCDIMRLRLGN